MHLVARRAVDFGIEIEGRVSFNLAHAVARKDGIVQSIIQGIYGALEQRHEAITFIRGQARFLNDHEIDTGESRLSFDKAIIATGARNVVPSAIEGIADIDFLTNRTALLLETLPTSMVIVGGGYIGLEFAQMYGRFGTQVTLLGRNQQLAHGEDMELAGLLADYLREEGVDVHTNAPVASVKTEGTNKVVSAWIDGEETDFVTETVLLAAGRIGNTEGLNLDATGVSVERGFIEVNDELCTGQPHIWAIGDVKGGWMFTHVATYDGPMAALNAVKGLGRTVDYRVVPRAIFTDPTFAAVGLTETEALARGFDVAIGAVPADGARSKAVGDKRGRLKAVVDKATNELLGFHILAPHGDDLLHEAVAAMHGHGSIERISKSIHIHPTLSEMVKAAAKAAR